MAKYADFLPYVLPYVAGCPEPLAEQHVRDICIDFCNHTLYVQETLDPIDVQANVSTYELAASGRVHLVMQAWFKRHKLVVFNGDSALNRAELHNTQFEDAQSTPGTPRALTMQGQSIMLDTPPLEDAPKALTVRAAVSPTRTSTTVDDSLFNEFAYEIGQGTIARLMLLPNQPFSSPEGAAMHHGQYVTARSKARIRSTNAMGRSATRIQPVRF